MAAGVLVTTFLMESSDIGDAAVSARDVGEQVHIVRASVIAVRTASFPAVDLSDCVRSIHSGARCRALSPLITLHYLCMIACAGAQVLLGLGKP